MDFSVAQLREDARGRGYGRPLQLSDGVNWEAVEDQLVAYHVALSDPPLILPPVTEFGALFAKYRITTALVRGRWTSMGFVVYGIVHDGEHARISFNENARSVRRSCGTSLDLALRVVGAEEALNHSTVTEFSLSLKEALEFVVVRDQPSGTLRESRPFAEW